MNTKREIYFMIIYNKFEPGNKNSYHINFNIIMKAYRKYNCAIINNGYDQKSENLKKCIVLDSKSKVDIFCNALLLNNIHKIYYPII